MQPTKFLSFLPKEMKLSAFTLSRYFTSLKFRFPSHRESFPSALALGEAAHPPSVPAGVPTGQLRRGEEIVSNKHLVCVEKQLFGDSQGVSTHITIPATPRLSAPRF